MRIALMTLLAALWCGSCFASLGGAPTDFGGQPVRQARILAAGAPAAFSVQVSTLPNGTLVREYIAPGGAVFAPRAARRRWPRSFSTLSARRR